MKVWKYSTQSAPIINFVTLENDRRVQNKITNETISGVFIDLDNFFQSKNYGKNLNEIFYDQRCLIEEHKTFISSYCEYNKKKKMITSIVELDYEVALELEVPELAKYIAKKYIDRSKDFCNLEIEDFDCQAYLDDLKRFFTMHSLI